MTPHTSEIVTLDRFNDLLEILIKKIQASEHFVPDTIVALSTGGFPVAAALAKRLGINSRSVVGLPIFKSEDGNYYLDEQLVTLGDCTGRQVLVVDESSNRGLLTRMMTEVVVSNGGVAKSCVLIAWEGGVQPDFVAEQSKGKPPKFYWELAAQ